MDTKKDQREFPYIQIPDEKMGDVKWEVRVDHIEIKGARQIILSNPSFDVNAVWGWCPLPGGGGYDALMWDERGGPVNAIFFQGKDGQVYFAMLSQYRRLMDTENPVLNAPRGFKDAGEKAADAASRELQEEASGMQVGPRIDLPGAPVNPNSGVQNTNQGRGLVYFYAFELMEEVVEETPEGPKLKNVEAKSTLIEKINKAQLVPLQEACHSGCALTALAAYRLRDHLIETGRI